MGRDVTYPQYARDERMIVRHRAIDHLSCFSGYSLRLVAAEDMEILDAQVAERQCRERQHILVKEKAPARGHAFIVCDLPCAYMWFVSRVSVHKKRASDTNNAPGAHGKVHLHSTFEFLGRLTMCTHPYQFS